MAKGKVDLEANLSADPGAGDVAATEQAESDGDTIVERVLATGKRLQLVFSQSAVEGEGAVEFRAKRDTGGEVVQKREAAGINLAASGLDPEDASARVARE